MELLILLAEKDGHVVSRQEIIARLWGKDVFVDTEHGINAEGVHPTIYCDGSKIAKMAESRKAAVSAKAGPHTCVALEKQYPGELNADSKKVSIQVKPGVTTYLRLESQFGHVHFVFRELPIDIGAAESAKMYPTKSSDSYTAVLPPNIEKQPSH